MKQKMYFVNCLIGSQLLIWQGPAVFNHNKKRVHFGEKITLISTTLKALGKCCAVLEEGTGGFLIEMHRTHSNC